MRTPGTTLDTDELERELGADELLGVELDEVATLELLGVELEVVATLELLGLELDVAGTLELLGLELDVAGTLELAGAELDDSPTTLVQVEREIQLLLFSQPQPLCVVTHKGYKVPYQLHCCPPLLFAELELTELELTTTGTELLERDELVVGTLEGVEETAAPEQIAPVTVGISAEPPRLST
jgi:hypothetical protein